MRGSPHHKLIWIVPISEYVSLRVISVVAKFNAFIINLNNFGWYLLDKNGTTPHNSEYSFQ